MLLAPGMQAQTFTVIHAFTGGSDGANPAAGFTLDRGGKLYGTTEWGGAPGELCSPGCGTVFKLAPAGSGWLLSSLYEFHSQDGNGTNAPVIFGPDGTLYGDIASVNGIIFNLKPPPTVCRSTNCSWEETILFLGCCFTFSPGGLTFDQQGNLYGGSEFEGVLNRCSGGLGCGLIYEMTPANGGGLNENTIFRFQGGNDGAHPMGNLIFDRAGNLYGTTGGFFGGDGFGSVFELTRSGGSWTKTNLYVFPSQFGPDGAFPTAGLVFDQAGNLYGATTTGGTGGGGTVFELTHANGSWNYQVIYSFPGSGSQPGVPASLILDSAGSLYGVTQSEGSYGYGSVFKLTRSNGGWTLTSLHDFTGGSDGAFPKGSLVMDAAGNLYGTTFAGGISGPYCANYESYQCGVAFEITP
jgi:uncharacterized repeat protein (TIGR03803 family)